MHFANVSAAAFSAAVGACGEPLVPRSLLHAVFADWNAGDDGLTPAIGWNPPPLAPGSGKFGTSCERMHSANLSPALGVPEVLAPADDPADPQAAITRPQLTAISALGKPCRWRFVSGI
jgi:hypothetical protein